MATFNDIQEWREKKEELDDVKPAEMSLRKEICADVFAGEVGKFKRKKTFTADEGKFAVTVEAESKVTVSFDEEVLQALQDESKLSIEELACIDSKTVIKEGPLRKLPKNAAIWKAITEKPAAPTLKIIEDEKDES